MRETVDLDLQGGARPVRPLPWPAAAAFGLILIVVGVGTGLVFGVGQELFGFGFVIALAIVIGAVLGLIAVTRFWVVVVALFVVRSALDSLKLASFGTEALDPGAVAGIVFLMGGTLWLLAQWRAGQLYRFSNSTTWILVFAAACMASIPGSADPVNSATAAAKVLAGALMWAVLEQAYRQKPERIKTILIAGGLSLLLPAAIVFQQLTGTNEPTDQFIEVSRIRGTFVHPNPFATFLVMITVVALAVRPHLQGPARVLATAVMGLGATLTLFTYARGAWIAMIGGIVIIGMKQNRKLLLALFAGMAIAVFAIPSIASRLSDLDDARQTSRGDPNSLAWRVQYWQELLPRVGENPVTGIGLEQVVAESDVELQPHNTFVQALVETGVVGFSALIGLCFALFSDLRRAIRTADPGLPRGLAVGAAAAVAGVASQLLSENLLAQAAMYWYLAGVTAWVLADLSRRRDEAAETASAATAPTDIGTDAVAVPA